MRRRQEQAYALICAHFDANGHVPTAAELGKIMGISGVGAWKHMNGLLEDGRLVRLKSGRIKLANRVDLRPVATDKLVSEVARRRAVSHAGASS